MNEEQARDQGGDEARLEALQEDIDEVRRRVDDPRDLDESDDSFLAEGERSFMEEGDGEGPGDDTIVPPG